MNMAENKMNEVAKLLGVELNEEFNIKNFHTNPFKITNDGLIDKNGCGSNQVILDALIRGIAEIEKVPFKPKNGDTYYCYSYKMRGNVNEYIWNSDEYDYINYYLGNCFRTEERARTKGKYLSERLKNNMELFRDEFDKVVNRVMSEERF